MQQDDHPKKKQQIYNRMSQIEKNQLCKVGVIQAST